MLKKWLNSIRPFLSNVYTRSVGVCVGTAVSDFVWTKYIGNIAGGSKLEAATWGAVVIVLGAYIVLSYVNDKRLIVAAALGAFIGTYYGV